MRAWILVTLTALAGGACTAAGPRQDDLERLERARFDAMTRQDIVALEPMLADDLVYCHSDGSCEGKREFLETIRSGRIRYLELKIIELRARVYSDVVVFNGVASMNGLLGGQPRSFNVVFTDVYERSGSGWQLIAWQSARKP